MKYIEVLHQKYHLQGFTTDGTFMYWSFTNTLVKTTMSGTVVAQIQVPVKFEHLGGIDYHNGRIYGAAMGNSLAGDKWGVWSSFTVHVYDAASLALIDILRLDDCYREYPARPNGFAGIGAVTAGVDPETGEEALFLGCAMQNGADIDRQVVLQYSFEGKRQKRYLVPIGPVEIGVQNIDRDPETGNYWLTTYNPKQPYHVRETLFCVSPDLTTVLAKYAVSTPYGFHCCGGGKFYASLQSGKNGHRVGYAYEADVALFEELDECPRSEGETNKTVMPRFDGEIGL